jgi:hypothetical protein
MSKRQIVPFNGRFSKAGYTPAPSTTDIVIERLKDVIDDFNNDNFASQSADIMAKAIRIHVNLSSWRGAS